MGIALAVAGCVTGKMKLRHVALPASRGIRGAGTRTAARAVTDAERYKAARRIRRGLAVDRAAGLLAAVAHAQRLAILAELLPGPCTHAQLAKATGLKAGPLYFHIRELRAAGLIGPKVRDLYELTGKGEQVLLVVIALDKLAASASG